jgi:3-oxoacyl-[acyl-carrier-protein] synthase III
MSGHTPGPWNADYGDFAAYCSTGAEVCEVMRGNHDNGTHIADDEMEANLRLLAAAPELLAACKIAANEIDAYIHAAPETTDPEMSEAARVLWCAIAKAEGRSE